MIRAIEDFDTKENIKGPLVVLLELLNQEIDVEGNKLLHLRLVQNDVEFDYDIQSQKRVGLGAGKFQDAPYNFSTK